MAMAGMTSPFWSPEIHRRTNQRGRSFSSNRYVRWSRSVLHLGAWEIILLFLTVSRKISMVTSFYWMIRKFKSFSQQQLAPPQIQQSNWTQMPSPKNEVVLQSPFIFGKLFVWDKFNTLLGTAWLDMESSKQLWRSLLPKKRWTGSTLQ